MQRKWDPILKAAKTLFLEAGIDATSMDDIARVAGTTKRTVYNNFGSKEQLVAAVFKAAEDDIGAFEVSLGPTPSREQLAAYAAMAIIALSSTYSVGFQRLIVAEGARVAPWSGRLVDVAHRAVAAPLARVLAGRDHPDPQAAAERAIERLTAEARLDRLMGRRPAYNPETPGPLDARDREAVEAFVAVMTANAV